MSWSSREELNHQVVTLARAGLSRRAIGRRLRVSRNTVKKILAEHDIARTEEHTKLPAPKDRAPRSKKIDPFERRVADLLEEYSDITAQRVFEELVAAGFEGSYTAVKEHVRAVRPKNKPEPSRPTPDYGLGEMAENDWSPYKIRFTDGKTSVVQAFAYVLCQSRRKSFWLYERSDFYALIDGHVATFKRFDGTARRCKYDGQKAVILRWEGRQPIFNPRFLAFATHYEFTPVACTPGRPNEKPHVERAFWEFERSFLNGRRFSDLDDMRRQLATWMDRTCDTRPHKKLKRSALEMFAEEREHLIPLPRHPYDTARVMYKLCSIDGFIAWDGNRYAVPYDHVTDILVVRVTQREIFVYAADLSLVARHELAPRSTGAEVGRQAHHKSRHTTAADLERVEKTFLEMGEAARGFFDALKHSAPRQSGFHARQILQLRRRYTTEDLCQAMAHALQYGALEHAAVARILGAKARPRTLDEYVEEKTARRLEEEVGATKIPPRDLAEYDGLGIEHPFEEEDLCQSNNQETPKSSSCSEDTSIS